VTRLYLVRHGPTHSKAMCGWSDLPADLSDTAALARLSAHLPTDAPILSSDLSRAITTADALALPTRRRLPHEPGLRELHFGAWELQTFAQAEAADPALIRAFWETPGPVRAPQGEGWDDLTARVGKVLDRLDQDTILVCHFGAILAAMQCCLGLTALDVFRHKIDNLSVTELHKGPSGWAMVRVNHIP
jgi:alpha-ribazole phosphatase